MVMPVRDWNDLNRSVRRGGLSALLQHSRDRCHCEGLRNTGVRNAASKYAFQFGDELDEAERVASFEVKVSIDRGGWRRQQSSPDRKYQLLKRGAGWSSGGRARVA